MQTYVALLRGINVGGHKKVQMAQLKEMCENLGLQNVRTYIQSGNVIFESKSEQLSDLEEQLERKIEETFGFSVAVIVRTPEQLANVLKNNPFLDRANGNTKFLYVAFLKKSPEKSLTTSIASSEFAPDLFEYHNQEIYLFYVSGAGRSKMTNDFFEKRWKIVSTMRNWNTTSALQKMIDLR